MKTIGIRGIDPQLWKRFNQRIKRENEGRGSNKGGLTNGQVVNELLDYWLENDGHITRATPAQLFREMLQGIQERAIQNQEVIGTRTVSRQEIDRVVLGVMARHGKVHDRTKVRYRNGVIEGFLQENRERIDGQTFVEFSIKEEHLPGYR